MSVERLAEQRAAGERKRQDAEKAKARAQHLTALAKRGEAAWSEVETLISARNPSAYDKATVLLVDLGEVAANGGNRPSFARRIAELGRRHVKKGQFMRRLGSAGLLPSAPE